MQVRFRPAQRSPEELDGIKIPYAAGKGKAHKLAWYLILLAVLSPVIYLSTGLAGAWLSLTANGTVFLEQQEVRAAQAGIVTRLDIKVGDSLQTGQTLLVLDNFELTAAAARNALERHAPAAAQRNAAAEAAVEEVRLRGRTLQYQQNRRATIQTLVSDGAATVAELNTAEYALTEAEAALMHARQALAVNTLGIDTADVERSVLESRRRSMTHHAPSAAGSSRCWSIRGNTCRLASPWWSSRGSTTLMSWPTPRRNSAPGCRWARGQPSASRTALRRWL